MRSNGKKLAKLLERAQSGDQHSLEELCKELEDYIKGYFQLKFKNNEIVDDLCQETYLRLLKSILLIRDKMKLKNFVAKVALHVMHDYLRQKYRLKEESVEIDSDDNEKHGNLKKEVVDLLTDEFDDQGILSRIDLYNALDKLSEKSRNILLLRTQGLDYKEISAQTGLSVSGVKMQMKRSIEQLRLILF